MLDLLCLLKIPWYILNQQTPMSSQTLDGEQRLCSTFACSSRRSSSATLSTMSLYTGGQESYPNMHDLTELQLQTKQAILCLAKG